MPKITRNQSILRNIQQGKPRRLTNAIVQIRVSVLGGVVQNVEVVDPTKVKQVVAVQVLDYDNKTEHMGHSSCVYVFDPIGEV